MIYNWYKLFSKTEFEATGLASRRLVVELEDLGEVVVLISRGNLLSITYDDVYLPINLVDQNPYAQENYAVYLDADNYVHLGIEVE